MEDPLPRLCPGVGESDAVGDIVEPPLQQLEQVRTRHPRQPPGPREVAAELPLQHTIGLARFLFLAKLDAPVGRAPPARLMVARRFVPLLDGALGRVTALSLQEKLLSRTAALPANRSCVSAHLSTFALYAPALRWPAAVVGYRRDVSDAVHRDPGSLQRPDRGFPACSGTSDEDLDLAQPMLHGLARRGLAHALCREGRALARATEPHATRAAPGDDVPLRVRQRHQGVVERRHDERFAARNKLPLATPRSCPVGSCHARSST